MSSNPARRQRFKDTTYERRFRWAQWDTTPEETYNEQEQTWTEGPKLWGRVEQLTATERLMYQAYYGTTDVKIYLSNYVPVKNRDGLLDLRFAEVYKVTGVERGDHEMIVLATRQKDIQRMFPDEQ